MPYVSAVIPAAGQGTRMGTRVNKQFLVLRDRPVLAHTLSIFQHCDLISEIIVVSALQEEDDCWELIRRHNFFKVKKVVTGGRERQYSVARGLSQLSGKCEWVAVHDGARPLLLPRQLKTVITEAFPQDGAVLAVRVKDTIKEVASDGIILSSPDRSRLWAVQTPQVFRKDVITFAYNQALQNNCLGTDDSMLVEMCGFKVKIVEGSYDNLKITTQDDLAVAEWILERRGRLG